MRAKVLILLCAFLLTVFTGSMNGQFRLFGPRQPKPTPPPVRKASEYFSRQAPLKVNQSLLKQATPDNTHIVVSIPKQRAYLMIGERIVADGPISSGRRGHESPMGHLNVLEKDPNHHSNLYGDFVDSSGRIVRAEVGARIFRRKRSSADWAANCLKVSRSVGKKNPFAMVSNPAEARAT